MRSPEKIAVLFHLDVIRNKYGAWVGLATIAAGIFWIIAIGAYFLEHYLKWRRVQKRKTEVLKGLYTLSIREQMVVAYCVKYKQQTVNLPVTHDAASALVAKEIMTRGSGHVLATPFTIPNFVWEWISERPLFDDVYLNSAEAHVAFQGLERDMLSGLRNF